MKSFLFLLAFLALAHGQILTVDRLFEMNKVHYVENIPSGAPPTNDGYAYSNLAYSKFYIDMAGQNGYDVCGNPLPIEDSILYYNITPRVIRTFYNIKAILECFHEPFTQIYKTDVYLSANFTFPSREFENEYYVNNRAIVNNVQRYPQFWGPTNPVMARFIGGIQWLSLGDVVEVNPNLIPRTNELPTCIDTGIAPPTADYLVKVDTAAHRYPCPSNAPLRFPFSLVK